MAKLENKRIIWSADFEERYGYDAYVDYDKVVRLYEKYRHDGNRDGMREILDKHGGVLALQIKWQYQHDQKDNQGL